MKIQSLQLAQMNFRGTDGAMPNGNLLTGTVTRPAANAVPTQQSIPNPALPFLMRSVSIWPVSFSAENFNSENKMRSRFRN
jgi:hypothetical protein